MNFEQALAFVEEHEGGWSDDPDDAGGLTRYGISSAAHPGVDLATLTRERAAEIYRSAYWDAVHGDELPSGVDLVVFDTAVQRGPAQAIRMLQRQLGVAVDGHLGPVTLQATRDQWRTLALRIIRDRVRHHFEHADAHPSQRRFLRGWINRCIDLAARI